MFNNVGSVDQIRDHNGGEATAERRANVSALKLVNTHNLEEASK